MNRIIKGCWFIKLSVIATVIVTVAETVLTGTVSLAPYMVLITGIAVMGSSLMSLVDAHYGK